MVRQPAVAGQFYNGDSAALAAEVDAMLAAAQGPAPAGEVVAIQVPHAGHVYSGPTAAHAFELLRGRESLTVVMIGPSHHTRIDRAAVFARGAWRTPLGDVPVDVEVAARLLSADSFCVDQPQAHAAEHSLEVQLPFLQRVLHDFKIVPVMLLFPSYEECERLGRSIAAAAAGRDLVVLASTDLYHGYSYSEARATDSLTVADFVGFEPRRLYGQLAQGKAQACGGFPVVAAMVAAREMGADTAVLLARTTSNDVTGERGGYCVGYSAVAFLSTGADDSGELTSDEQAKLLGLARRTIESQLQGKSFPTAAGMPARLMAMRGVFVTLHRKGQLRGCIGYPEAVRPLGEAVIEMAVAAATEDPRFVPVTLDELKDVDIEITVLSPLAPISPESVEVGRHGLVIRKGGRSGLLLPQVPVEQDWDRAEYLEGICQKAGLPPGTWRERDAKLFGFTGQVFGERDAAPVKR
jgi:AmmeMemoRadiSam system protein B/AmmeMemoRadiSam system protein A